MANEPHSRRSAVDQRQTHTAVRWLSHGYSCRSRTAERARRHIQIHFHARTPEWRTSMSDPLIVCPKSSTPIKLTDSLAAPLIAKTRRQFEEQLAQKDADFAKREVGLRKSQKAVAKAREAIDDEVAKRLQIERVSITESEKKKARIALAADLKQRGRLLAELQGNLDANNAKLAEAQQAHADVLRKSRELDDAKRELDLSVQKKGHESLAAVRDQAKAEPHDRHRG